MPLADIIISGGGGLRFVVMVAGYREIILKCVSKFRDIPGDH